MSWLIAFNVINTHNEFVRQIFHLLPNFATAFNCLFT
jgi:hypothetical protein